MEATMTNIETIEFEFDANAFKAQPVKKEKKEVFNPYKVGLYIGMR